MAGNFERCVARVVAKSGLTQEQATEALQTVADRGGDITEAVKALTAEATTAAQRSKFDAGRNATIRASIMDAVAKGGGIEKAEQTLRSILHGTNAGSRDSIQAMWHGNTAGWQAALEAELKKSIGGPVAVSGALDDHIAREMWSLNSGQKNPVPAPAAARAADSEARAARSRHWPPRPSPSCC